MGPEQSEDETAKELLPEAFAAVLAAYERHLRAERDLSGHTVVLLADWPGDFWAGNGTARLHRWSGRLAFLLTIPVAMHCLYALGFQSYDTRTLVHSLLGCLFFGAFTVKMLILPKHNIPGWVLPVAGGIVFTVLMAVWETSAFWFFTTIGVKF